MANFLAHRQILGQIFCNQAAMCAAMVLRHRLNSASRDHPLGFSELNEGVPLRKVPDSNRAGWGRFGSNA